MNASDAVSWMSSKRFAAITSHLFCKSNNATQRNDTQGGPATSRVVGVGEGHKFKVTAEGREREVRETFIGPSRDWGMENPIKSPVDYYPSSGAKLINYCKNANCHKTHLHATRSKSPPWTYWLALELPGLNKSQMVQLNTVKWP